MTKYQKFYNNLNITLEGLNTSEVKATIGDSINNNRVLTVGQLVRFLTNAGRTNKVLGSNLNIIYDLLRNDIVSSRLNGRTDAIDINEFINFYEATVIGSGEFRPLVSRNISL